MNDDEINTLEDLMRYALFLAKNFCYVRKLPAHVSDDMRQAARLGAWQAWERFDPEKGIKLKTYSTRRIVGAMIDEIRETWPHHRVRRAKARRAKTYSIEAIYGSVVANNTHKEKAISDRFSISEELFVDKWTHPVGWEMESEEEVRKITKALPKDQGDVLRSLYLEADKCRMRQAGEAHGFSESRVSQIHTTLCEAVNPQYNEAEDMDRRHRRRTAAYPRGDQ